MSKHLYVGNLPHECTEQELRAFIESSGHAVQSASIVLDRSSGRSRGFAFAQMASEDGGLGAIESLQGKTLGGRAIRVGAAKAETRRVVERNTGYEHDARNERPKGRRRR